MGMASTVSEHCTLQTDAMLDVPVHIIPLTRPTPALRPLGTLSPFVEGGEGSGIVHAKALLGEANEDYDKDGTKRL
jgi:hypothetical protein